MTQRRFLIAFEMMHLDESGVRQGRISPEAVVACSCVIVGLFLSGDLRRDLTVSIAAGASKDLSVISFPGMTLKRVSPDERSISFFLLKANSIVNRLEIGHSKMMDNGIIVERGELEELVEGWKSSKLFLAILDPKKQPNYEISCEGLYVYENKPGLLTESSVRNSFQLLPRPPHPERFILDVNMYCDQR